MASRERETHPAWGQIAAYRTSISPPGSPLFDSDIRHQHTVVVRINEASRTRDLHHDWIIDGKELIEIEMSEAQWASFVSSMNTSGVPCTLRTVAGVDRERVKFAPRLEESLRETRDAADRAFAQIDEAARLVEEKPTKANIRALRITIQNATPNVEYAAKTLGEHAENVVTKARADVEAMVARQAHQLGIEAADVEAPPQIEQA